MGVWIETLDARVDLVNAQSHPVWVCGLKLALVCCCLASSVVTPCMGVWIETTLLQREVYFLLMSHPVWVCGLKQIIALIATQIIGHTLYGCVD